jgi:hypothetical protein
MGGGRIGPHEAGPGAKRLTSVALGYMEVLRSVSDNAALSFGLIDNVVVTSE